jgi:Tfp pilus assembly protein PilN
MKALDLDLARSRSPRAGWVLLGLALFAVFDAGLSYRQLSNDAAVAQRQLARHSGRTPTSATRAEKADEALHEADRVARSLMRPWDSLFRTLEQATDERVALLALQPDARKGEISISGEAKDYDAVLAFVTRLDERKTLRDVHLVRHEVREDDPQHPMYFSILANWEEGP